MRNTIHSSTAHNQSQFGVPKMPRAAPEPLRQLLQEDALHTRSHKMHASEENRSQNI